MTMGWIKVEKATARKPEVLCLARLLRITPDAAFGLCVRFWMWCDDHMASDTVGLLGVEDVDRAVGVKGLGAALKRVGWLQILPDKLVVPHFDRHLSQSAKKRAEENDRKKREREADESRTEHGQTTDNARTNSGQNADKTRTESGQDADEKRPREEKSIYSAPPPNFIGGDPLDGLTPGLSEDPMQIEAQFSAAWNACASVSSKLRSGLPHNLRQTFWVTWNDPEWRAVLWRAIERIKQPLPGGKRFKIQNFLEQTTLQDLAEGTHSWLMGHGTDQGKPRLMTDEEKENWRP